MNKRQRKKQLKLFDMKLKEFSTAANGVVQTMSKMSECMFSVLENFRKSIAPNFRLGLFKRKISKRDYYLEYK